MAFVDSVFDNDEKVESSKKPIQIKTRLQNPYPIYDENGQTHLTRMFEGDLPTTQWAAVTTHCG